MAINKGIAMKRNSALPVEGVESYEANDREEYMNNAQQEHFRQVLSAWKRSLMQEADRTVRNMRIDETHLSDPSDRATKEEEFALELRTRDRERKLIRKIDKTLRKLKDDEYGYCEACGIEIGLRRLEVRPTAALCIDCKTTQEIKERQLG